MSGTSPSLSLVSSEGSIESPTDLTPRQLWQSEIEAADKEMEKFLERAKIADERFKDERDVITSDNKWFNIYYANTNILTSALYADLPEPEVCRRYEDYKDQVARVAALILQRGLKQDLNDPEDQFHETMKQCVQDRLIPGMGVAWLRFETETEAVPTSKGGTVTNNAQSTQPHATGPDGKHNDGFEVPATADGIVPLMKIKNQTVIVDYVHWRDFRFSPCRTWGERRWVARRVFMTREQLTKRFGATKAKLCALDHNTINSETTSVTPIAGKDVFKKATVWEIWDRTKREVIWYAPGLPNDLLDKRAVFLHLQSFEACPKPMLANITTSSTIPRPDYYMIQDQYSELNEVNSRISWLVKACKVVGVYDQAAVVALQGIFNGMENTMVPVPNWAQFSEKGGVKGSVDWIPLDQIVVALQRLYESREAIKGQIYELTGISDIVRGESKASETLGAQRIKQQFASIRIKKLQAEVSEFASDILRIKGEMMAKLYEPATLIRKSGIIYTDNHEWVVEAILLLKSEEGFNWRIEVQADSMSMADYEMEKKERVEFMSMMTGYLAQALPMAGQIPELKPIIFGMLKWAISAFKGAAPIEGMIDKQLAQLEGKPPPPPKPDPQEMAAQAKLQQTQMKGQIDQQKAAADMQGKQQELQMERERNEMELQMQREEMAMAQQEHEQEMQFKREEMQMKAQEQQVNLQATIEQNQVDMQTHQQLAQQKVQDSMIQSDIAHEKGEMELRQSEQAHQQTMAQQKEAGSQKLKQDKAAGQQALVLKKAAAKQTPKKGK